VDFSQRNVYLVCYDIAEPRRLARVRRVCLGFGEPVQLSVFRCTLTAQELVDLQDRLRQTMNVREDKVLFADIGPSDGRGRDAVSTLGEGISREIRGAIVI
jgi:CRISPR-associated protein Cas2